MSTNYALIGTSLLLIAATACFYLMPLRAPKNAGKHRLSPAIEDSQTMDATLWPTGFPHDAPDEPFTVFQAHKAMQLHRNCQKEECPRKSAAFRTLVEAGTIKPVGYAR